MNSKYIIGIDEVGRGPVAGPVAVCSFSCKSDFFDSIKTKTPLRDSKKLSEKQRNEWFTYLKKCKADGLCNYSVSFVSAETIDKFGIVKAIQKALDTSLSKLNANGQLLEAMIYLDGGLKASEQFINQETTIRGDEIHKVISCASIIAKVSRDSIMRGYAKEYPEYGFENHVGYGTKAHYDAITKHGMTMLHRKTFLKNKKT